ncbi:MAG: TonB-dependent receptor [Paludibacteraceae bacterium]
MKQMKFLSVKFYFLFFILTLNLFSARLYAQQYSVSGYITDESNGETLINASVLDRNSSNGKVSNVYGFYSIRLQKGEVNLQYSYVSYLSKNIRFNLTKDTIINIQLGSNTTLQEVTVIGNRNEIGVKGSQMSAIEVPITQIKTIPSLFGETDVLKALQLLPGVQAGSEGSAGLYVRGGGPDENLLIFDGIPVYNVNHAMGLFSVFNPDAVKNVTLYKGSFPARFGERLSSVVDIRMKDGDDKNYHGTVSVGLISSKANIEGPIIKEKTTFNISFRRTYADLLMQPVIKIMAKQNDLESASAGYYFYDFNTKVTHKINDKNKLFLSVYSGDDGIYFGNKYKYDYGSDNETVNDKLNWKWGNFISALKWNRVLSGKLFMNVTAAYTQYRFNMKLNEELTSKSNKNESSSEMELGYKTGINDYSTRLDFDYAPSTKHDVKFGVSHTYHTFRPVLSHLI